MDRNKAIEIIAKTPEFIPGACPWCGATTFEEAATKCKPAQLSQSGEWTCGSPEEGPNSENETGPLFQRNPEYDRLDGYLWGWYAVDAGYTETPPEWDDEP